MTKAEFDQSFQDNELEVVVRVYEQFSLVPNKEERKIAYQEKKEQHYRAQLITLDQYLGWEIDKDSLTIVFGI